MKSLLESLQIFATIGAVGISTCLIALAPLAAFSRAMGAAFAPTEPNRHYDIRGYLIAGIIIGLPIALSLLAFGLNSSTKLFHTGRAAIASMTIVGTHLLTIGYYLFLKYDPFTIADNPVFCLLPWGLGLIAVVILIRTLKVDSSSTNNNREASSTAGLD